MTVIIFALSDKICTALQLANHWQDVREDWNRGRIYLPQKDMERFEVSEQDIDRKNCSGRFKSLMRFEVERAQDLLHEGLPLLSKVDGRLKAQLSLYWCGGMGALNAVKRIDYDVLNRSARLNRFRKIIVGANAILRWVTV